MEDETGEVVITLGDLRMEAKGSIDVLRRTIAEFFVKLGSMKRGSQAQVIVRGKSIREVLLDLRDGGFFDEPRDTAACYGRLKELGRTDITRNAVAMALKHLVEDGSLTRKAAGKTFSHINPAAAP